ncbi:hypothetical protein NUU61_009765 [Penicillium alfredii]|uniref:MutL C-terminal dimerisation domain-containing protein n=1 Tax=Penicillium alfredii TaxID=1506179 RepID=A0A9W9EGS3_9EURO|nr:uncharacterized protein NUU61_009765 [Penicillium alfredii]KAJ5081501.1 hypothetical protein NUU61_009765 [Penicillium alfredii]
MSSSGSTIRPLPSDVAAKIKSSTSITHLTGVIVELVKNSLDANSHTVFVTVDFARGSCVVEDDGHGIAPAEFQSHGGLGKAHHTSKFQVTSAYGHRGLYLASLASLSLLTVTSHHRHHQSTNSIIFHHSTPVARLVPAPVHQELRFRDHGTCVTVNNLFGNMPVRVKSRALALQRPDELEREWDTLKYSLVALMLPNPQFSKLVLSDAAKTKKVTVRLDGSVSQNQAGLQSELNLRRIGSILVQSGMVAARGLDSWHVMSASIPDLMVCAAISVAPSQTKQAQFISLGTDPILSRNQSNVLYNEVNRLFALSDFGTMGAMPEETSAASQASLDRSESMTVTSARGWARPLNKWPMFFIRINSSAARKLHNDGHEALPESDQSLQRILDVLEAMIQEFLNQHNLRPRATKRSGRMPDRTRHASGRGQEAAGQPVGTVKQNFPTASTEEAFSSRLKLPSFQKAQSTLSGPSFNSWSRVKAAKDPNSQSPRQVQAESGGMPGRNARDHTRNPHPDHQERLNGQGQEIEGQTIQSNVTPSDGDYIGTVNDLSCNAKDSLIPWVDPHTGEKHMINSRTGQTMDPRKSIIAMGSRTTDFAAGFSTADQVRRTQSAPTQIQNLWVDNLLKSWENPTFTRTETPISNLQPIAPGIQKSGFQESLHEIGTLGIAHVAKFRGRLQRHSLEAAEIIAQVDRKYIVAKIGVASVNEARENAAEEVLVLIDQHAADERSRVEQLFEEMFLPTIPSQTLPRSRRVQTVQVEPVAFEISPTENLLFRKYSHFFSSWGICYDTDETSGSAALVSVHTLPTLIAERCRLEPNLVIDLIRREVWEREDNGVGPLGSKTAPEEKDIARLNFFPSDEEPPPMQNTDAARHAPLWVQQIGGCPQVIIDLLNSRACRSAIMFNDPLSLDDCQALVSRLARCAFPFQCAHGRPSMVPILDLRSPSYASDSLVPQADVMSTSLDQEDGADLSFLEAFRACYAT